MRYIEDLACAQLPRVHDGAETLSTISLKQASTIAEMRSETRVKLIPKCQHLAGWAEYFRLIDPHLNDGSVSPFNLGQVFGLPKS